MKVKMWLWDGTMNGCFDYYKEEGTQWIGMGNVVLQRSANNHSTL
jgi:hypothetical protein